MKNTAYPVIFEEDNGGYFVTVPDLDKNTQGSDLADAISMARDLISLWLVELEDEGQPIPAPGSVSFIAPTGAIVSYVDVNVDAYRKNMAQRLLRKIVVFLHGLILKQKN